MSTMTTLSQQHQEVAQLEARASAAEARATAAEEELKRYQRNTGGHIQLLTQRHEASQEADAVATKVLTCPSMALEQAIYTAAEFAIQAHADRWTLLDITRQQQAELDDLRSVKSILEEEAESRHKTNMRRIEKVRALLGQRLHEQWDQALVRFVSAQRGQERGRHMEAVRLRKRIVQQQAEIERLRKERDELQGQLHDALEDVTEQRNKRHEAEERLREYEDKTEPQPKVEPELLEKFESLQDAPKEEAYRAGLPPEALRKAWPEWEDSQGDRLRFTEDGERFGFLTLSGAAIESESTYIAEDSNGGQFAVCKHRPHGATWFEVEQRAARLLGQAGAKAGRDRMSLERLWTVIGAPDHDGKVAYAAYHAGYDGAIEYRDACNGGLLGGERYRVFQELGCEWEYTPKYEAWRPTLNGKPIPWSRVGG